MLRGNTQSTAKYKFDQKENAARPGTPSNWWLLDGFLALRHPTDVGEKNKEKAGRSK